jgi:hypothetical protein
MDSLTTLKIATKVKVSVLSSSLFLLEFATGSTKPTCANVSDAALQFPAQRLPALGWTRDEAVE